MIKLFDLSLFSKLKNFTTEENTELLETKLVDIMEDISLMNNKSLTIEKVKEENSLILVTAKYHEIAKGQPTNEIKLPSWTVSPYDLGGHSPYFSSQKIFSSPSSFVS